MEAQVMQNELDILNLGVSGTVECRWETEYFGVKDDDSYNSIGQLTDRRYQLGQSDWHNWELLLNQWNIRHYLQWLKISNELNVNGSGLIGDTVHTTSNGWNTSDSQFILGGPHNTGYNTGTKTKLLITGYDNDGSSIFPIYIEDENGNADFVVKKTETLASIPTLPVTNWISTAEV